MVFFKLIECDMFGGRVLVTKSDQSQGKQLDEPSLLSVIAESAEVEIILIDKANMHLYSEDVQKLLNQKLSTIFEVDKPYPDKIIDKIKDKFRLWDQFKISTFIMHMQNNFNIKNA